MKTIVDRPESKRAFFEGYREKSRHRDEPEPVEEPHARALRRGRGPRVMRGVDEYECHDEVTNHVDKECLWHPSLKVILSALNVPEPACPENGRREPNHSDCGLDDRGNRESEKIDGKCLHVGRLGPERVSANVRFCF